jgi:hypothetical protein
VKKSRIRSTSRSRHCPEPDQQCRSSWARAGLGSRCRRCQRTRVDNALAYLYLHITMMMLACSAQRIPTNVILIPTFLPFSNSCRDQILVVEQWPRLHPPDGHPNLTHPSKYGTAA